MTYAIQLEHRLEQKLVKLEKKDRKTYTRVINKIIDLSQNPYAGKPLRSVLKGRWRVHIGPFVLILESPNNIERSHSWNLSITITHTN